ncbi:MAG: hypothetical protein GMKNLPBB_02638 [Myxococcota bacterium]|nr:hypothetical protein [Myxococcota bacterium]
MAAELLLDCGAHAALINHTARTWLLARAWADQHRIRHDAECLAVAALLHDLGLCPARSGRRGPFTWAGADAAREILIRGGCEVLAPPAARAIELHMRPWPTWSAGAEAGLLHVAAWMDITRARSWRLPRDQRTDIARAWPRAGIDWRFPFWLASSVGSLQSVTGLLAARETTNRGAAPDGTNT